MSESKTPRATKLFPKGWTTGLVTLAGIGMIYAGALPLPALLRAPAAWSQVAPQPTRAEEVFKAMEEKLRKASSLRLKVAMTLHGREKEDRKHAGMLALQRTENRVRMSLDPFLDLASDGERCSLEFDVPEFRVLLGGKGVAKGEAPPDLSRNVALALARMGLETCSEDLMPTAVEPTWEIEDPTGLKLGARELVGTTQTQAVEYKISRVNGSHGPTERSFTVWIDLKTSVPVKRIQVFKEGDREVTVTETYTGWEIDQEIPLQVFQVKK